jgi:PAS domain S-box-containing protein
MDDATGPAPRPGTGGAAALRRWRIIGILVAAALLGGAVAGTGWLSWRGAWQDAERDLQRAADAGAAAGLRILEGQRLAADVVNEMLRGLSDAEIRAREAELHQRIVAMVRSQPLIQSVIVADRMGRPLVSARAYPVPQHLDYSRQEWFGPMSGPNPPSLYVSGIGVGRLDGQLFFSLTRRRSGSANGLPPDAFDGAVSVSVSPNVLAAAFGELTGGSTDTASLVRTDGRVLMRTPRVPEPLPDIPPGSPLREAAARGQPRGVYLGSALIPSGDGARERRLLAFRRIDGLPLYATVARPTAEIAASWRLGTLRTLSIAFPALTALAALGWLAWRRSRAAAAAEAALLREAGLRAETEARRRAETRFRGVFESRVIGMAVHDLVTGEPELVNDRLLELIGRSRAEFESGRLDWRSTTVPEHLARDMEAIAEARRQGWWTPYEKDYLRPDGSRQPVRVSSAPLPGEAGRVVVAVQDISEQRAAESRRDLLLREVDHRAKNALAAARAALRLTRAATTEEFVRVVDGRIGALAHAIDALARTGWTGAELEELLRGELAHFLDPGRDGPRISLSGPRLGIVARAVQPLTMAVHELATNAVKHGALSVPGGVVELRWRVTEGRSGALRIVWTERGGPCVAAPPAVLGFGSRLLTATIANQLSGKVEQEWAEGGLICTMRLPASVLSSEAGAEGPEPSASPSGAASPQRSTAG